MNTRSARPLATISSACSGAMIMPTAPVARPAPRFDRLGERHLIAGMKRGTFWSRMHAARGTIDQVHLPGRRQPLATATVSSMVSPPGIQSVQDSRTNSGSSSGHSRAHRVHHLQQQPRAAGEVAAVVVVAGLLIGDRNEWIR